MCKDCIYFIYDDSTGQSDCKQADNMTEQETQDYFTNDLPKCPYKEV